MTEEQLREKIAQKLYDKEFGGEISDEFGGLYPENLMELEGSDTNQILALIQEAGYVRLDIQALNKIAGGEELPSVIGTTLDGQPLIKGEKERKYRPK